MGNQMTITRLLDGWHIGKPLRTALLSLADADEKKAILAEQTGLLWGMAKIIAETHQYALENKISFAEATPLMREKFDTERKHQAAAKKRLFDLLRAKKLLAVGFEPPRTFESKPLVIPFAYLHQKIDWENDVIRSDSLTFVDVRIVDGSFEQNPIRTVSLANNIGRKSRESFYFECFAALTKQGKFDPTSSQKSHFQDVRKWLAENHPKTFTRPDVGSDKTIYRYIKKFRDVSNGKS